MQKLKAEQIFGYFFKQKKNKKKKERKKQRKKETNERVSKDRKIRDIMTLFEHKGDYYKPKRVSNF